MTNTGEDKHTYRIIHSRYQPETKVHDIYQEILYANPCYRPELLQTFDFKRPVYNFLVVYEWIAFEDYESFKVALSLVYSQEMFTILTHELQLFEITAILEKASQSVKLKTGQNEALFSNCEKQYYSQKPAIFQKLLDYVQMNLNDFP